MIRGRGTAAFSAGEDAVPPHFPPEHDDNVTAVSWYARYETFDQAADVFSAGWCISPSILDGS